MKKNTLYLILGSLLLLIAALFFFYSNNNLQNSDQESKNKQTLVEKYINENISKLSDEKEVLGGKFFVTSFDFVDNNNVKIEYEDGHNLYEASVVYEIINENIIIENFVVLSVNGESLDDKNEAVQVSKEELPIPSKGKIGAIDCKSEQRNADTCIEIYQPVCGQVKAICKKEPCDFVRETFENSCKACMDPKVLSYTKGECFESDEIKR